MASQVPAVLAVRYWFHERNTMWRPRPRSLSPLALKKSALDGVAAVAVGIIAATLVQLAMSALHRLDAPVVALPIFLAAALAAWKLKGKWVTPAIVAAGAAAGAILLA